MVAKGRKMLLYITHLLIAIQVQLLMLGLKFIYLIIVSGVVRRMVSIVVNVLRYELLFTLVSYQEIKNKDEPLSLTFNPAPSTRSITEIPYLCW